MGKSLIVTGLCRIFRNMGVKTAPFKAQNMALNSYVTREGGEIGRAQALQAEASGIEPTVHMNPVLLKATGEAGSQVIIRGKVHSNMTAQEYYEFKDTAWEAVTASLNKLSENYELIIIEGAGSPAEINLMDKEVVNMAVARYADAPVVLTGDIDRGGVFASLYGTTALLDKDAHYIKAFIINKFRGDPEILKPGNIQIEEKTGIPVIGVLPYVKNPGLHEEDGLSLETKACDIPESGMAAIKIVILRLRYMANFTDFDPFAFEPDVELLYSVRKDDLLNCDLIVIPGSKNTIKDMLFLKESGLDKVLNKAVHKGISIIGICGGYQLLGKSIEDPYNVEGSLNEIKGLGFLDITTTLNRVKTTCRVEAGFRGGLPYIGGEHSGLSGYEIHMGTTRNSSALFDITPLNNSAGYMDGASKGNVWGTYIHGVFDNNGFRRALINGLKAKKGLSLHERGIDYTRLREQHLNQWVDIIKTHIDIDFIKRLTRFDF